MKRILLFIFLIVLIFVLTGCKTKEIEIDGKKVQISNPQPIEDKKSFGANITDLLADSFFIEDGLIGDFAKGKIEEVLNDLIKKRPCKKEKRFEYKKIINLIDEPIIRMKLEDMYKSKYENYDKN